MRNVLKIKKAPYLQTITRPYYSNWAEGNAHVQWGHWEVLCPEKYGTKRDAFIIGIEAKPLIKYILQSKQAGAMKWRELSREGQTSIIKFLQIYTDKSRCTMNTSALVFYHFHVLMMNISHDVNKNIIAMGQIVVAYLPTSFLWNWNWKCFVWQLYGKHSEATQHTSRKYEVNS